MSSSLSKHSHRYCACLQYVGSAYHGWQKQPHGHDSVQAQVEAALSKVADHPVTTVCAGRTDSGVHALGQVIHFDAHASRTHQAWLNGTNHHLPPDIKLLWVKQAPADFHARFSATSRTYYYFIDQAKTPNPFMHKRMLWLPQPLDLFALNKAASVWLGEHDFSSFRDSHCQSHTPFRNLMYCQAEATEPSVVRITIQANAFLHHMIRNMMGVLIPIGLGQKPMSWANSVLKARSRSSAGKTLAAHALYFAQVDYPSAVINQWF